MIQGRHIYHEPAIIDCSAARIWLSEENLECIRHVIMLSGDWHPPADMTTAEEDDFVSINVRLVVANYSCLSSTPTPLPKKC